MQKKVFKNKSAIRESLDAKDQILDFQLKIYQHSTKFALLAANQMKLFAKPRLELYILKSHMGWLIKI